MKSPSQDPRMFDAFVEFEGIRLHVDPISRKRSDKSDNVMAVFYEEQPVTWRLASPYIKEALRQSNGFIDFLDVGCGSGVFGILVAKHFPGSKVVAIDKSRRAIEMSKKNMDINGVSMELRHEFYGMKSVPEKSLKVIGIYAPYHIYPPEIENKIPQHARGGSDGQREFKSQLSIARHHLAENGIIFFNQMCLGSEEGPAYLEYIPKIFDKPSLLYIDIFPRIETRIFLAGVYKGRHREFCETLEMAFPYTYYTVGIVKNDQQVRMRNFTIEEIPDFTDLHGRTWQDRIALHREIAMHEFK